MHIPVVGFNFLGVLKPSLFIAPVLLTATVADFVEDSCDSVEDSMRRRQR